MRHVRACNNVRLPGDRCPLRIDGSLVGWASPAIAAALEDFPGVGYDGEGLLLMDPEALPTIAWNLAARGLFRWRGEPFDVRADCAGPVLAQIDRGALPAFGLQAQGVHVNGLVSRRDGLHLWVATRAKDKPLDAGKLDHIVAGGVPAGLGPWETLIKEASEEASIPPSLAAEAIAMSTVEYAMIRPEGLRRDVLSCYDLMLPDDFIPVAADREVEDFALWPIDRALAAVRTTDDFKFNVNLVLIDLFIRKGLITGTQATDLRAALAGVAAG